MTNEDKPNPETTNSDTESLHFIRLREKGDESFYDPASDFRTLLPNIVRLVTDQLAAVYEPLDEEIYNGLVYLSACCDVFRIKVSEDPTPVAESVAEFVRAIQTVQPEIRFIWYRGLMTMCMATWALFTRRDTKADRVTLNNMLNNATVDTFLSVLPEETVKQIRKIYEERGILVRMQEVISPKSIVKVMETDELITDHVKELARQIIKAGPNSNWNSLAEACDKAFNELSDVSDVQADSKKFALALAYPTYEKPTLMVDKHK